MGWYPFSNQQTFPGRATFTAPGAGTTGSVVTDDITVKPNSGISTSASMFLDNGAGQVWEFFCDAGGSFGAFDKTHGQQRITAGPNQACKAAFQNNLFQVYSGHVEVHDAGFGLQVAEGANCKQGVATLVAGTVTVADTAVTANSRIFLTAQDNNSTGALRVSARTAGVSFVITSSNAADSGVVAYEIFEPAA